MKIEIQKKEQHFSFDAEPGEKLLYAGLRAGIPLPYECATGTCGTCRARLKEGEIDEGWAEAPGKSGLKPDRQEFLLCQAHAKAENRIETANCQLGIPSAIKAFRDDDLTPSHCQGHIGNWQQLTQDVIQFDVVLDSAVRFHAGQFFVLDVPGVEGFRAYSMVNYAPETNTLTFIVKNKPGGVFSAWAFDPERRAGTEPEKIALFGPLGRATFHPDETSDLFMVAGGSGIAGLMSILRHAEECQHFEQHSATVFFGVRTTDDAFYISELSAIKERYSEKIDIHIIFSNQDELPEGVFEHMPELEQLKSGFGFVHEQALANIAPGLTNTMVYLAGPPPMVDALIRPLILEAKLPVTKIRYDKFG